MIRNSFISIQGQNWLLWPCRNFTEEAASTIGDHLIPFDSILEVLDAVEKDEVDIGVVPIENSIEGPVGSYPRSSCS